MDDQRAEMVRRLSMAVPPSERINDFTAKDFGREPAILKSVVRRWVRNCSISVALMVMMLWWYGVRVIGPARVEALTVAEAAVPQLSKMADDARELKAYAAGVGLIKGLLFVQVSNEHKSWLSRFTGRDEIMSEPRRVELLMFLARQYLETAEADRVAFVESLLATMAIVKDASARHAVEAFKTLDNQKRATLATVDKTRLGLCLGSIQKGDADRSEVERQERFAIADGEETKRRLAVVQDQRRTLALQSRELSNSFASNRYALDQYRACAARVRIH
jgi:hypothetical protein